MIALLVRSAKLQSAVHRKTMYTPSLVAFILHISEICKQDTSSDPEGWTPENPTWGHCAIVAVLVQELYGGDIWRASLTHIPKLAHVRSHYGNLLPTRAILDVTAPQYWPDYPPLLELSLSSRAHVLGNADTLARYAVFHKRYLSLAFSLSSRESLKVSSKRANVGRVVPRRPRTK